MQRTALIYDSYPRPAEMDTALSDATLRLVAGGELPDVLRIFVPARIVAFGRQDSHSPGFLDAVHHARSHNFDAVLRLAGGRAAVFHEQTLAFSWQTATAEPKLGITQRFANVAELLVDALGALNISAAIGETTGEYCPGRFSVHSGGRKVIGIGQRLIRGAAHIGGVIVVDDQESINTVLKPIYDALDLSFDPGATGALAQVSNVSIELVRGAVVGAFSDRLDLFEAVMPDRALADARALMSAHAIAR